MVKICLDHYNEGLNFVNEMVRVLKFAGIFNLILTLKLSDTGTLFGIEGQPRLSL